MSSLRWRRPQGEGYTFKAESNGQLVHIMAGQPQSTMRNNRIRFCKKFAVVSIIAFFFTHNINETLLKGTSSSSKTIFPQNQIDLIADFTHAVVPVNEAQLKIERPRPPNGGFLFSTPFIIQDGKLFCHPNLEILLRQSTFIDMIRAALDSCEDDHPHCKSIWGRWKRRMRWPRWLPLMLFHDDHNGCNVSERTDMFAYPRFSWSQPATKYGDDWCNTISVPTYSNWEAFRDMKQSSWDAKLASNSEKYPWSSKIYKAVWRGSTTYHPSLWGAELNDTPRGILVQTSMKHPELIDAAFVNLVQYYKGSEDELRNQTIISQSMPFEEQMAYRAIIDIDGNNWSSRFASLLCTNSVIIKVRVYCYVCVHYHSNWYSDIFSWHSSF